MGGGKELELKTWGSEACSLRPLETRGEKCLLGVPSDVKSGGSKERRALATSMSKG